jgi:RNA polymerase sigma-70 factor (ECF subfamily)
MWPDSNDTRELLQRAERNDADAVNALFGRHREALRRMIAQRLDRDLARRVDASDIAQAALLDASRRLSDYLRQPTLPFHLWLRQIARDRLIEAHRRHRVSQRRSIDRERAIDAGAYEDRSALELAQAFCDPGLTPAAAAVRHEVEERFHAALQTMSEDDREVLLMRHFEHLSNQEVAQALALSEAAAGMRYLRALRRLRTILGEVPSQANEHER